MSKTPLHIAILRICHRGTRRRLWLAGRRLADCGFAPGCDYSIARKNGALVLTLTEGMGRKVHRKFVSKRPTPVIDIANEEIEAFSKGRDVRLHAQFFPGRIVVTIHPDDEAAGRREMSLGRRIAARMPLRMGSLAHGIGVLDHALKTGLAAAGAKAQTTFAVEADQRYLEASLANNSIWHDGGTSIHGRIQDVPLSDFQKVDILAAGLPCTGASLVGRAATRRVPEYHPEAGLLFLHFLRIVEVTEPAVVVLENVPAYANTVSFHAIQETLKHRGYAISDAILSGPEHGALENRKRLVMIARPSSMRDPLSCLPTADSNHAVSDILDVSVSENAWFDDKAVKAMSKKAISKGNNFKAALLDGDERSVPVLTHGYPTTRATNPYLRHKTKEGLIRRFTPAEHARIKTAPEGLVRELPPTTAHEALGQSVIHRAFVHLGEAIGAALSEWAGRPVIAGAV